MMADDEHVHRRITLPAQGSDDEPARSLVPVNEVLGLAAVRRRNHDPTVVPTDEGVERS